MQAYNRLTTIHFSRIIAFIKFDYLDLSSFKESLPIVGVCKSWRANALPEVYKTLFVDNMNNEFSRMWFYRKDDGIYYISNASLIISSKCTRFTKRCAIELDSLSTLKKVMKYNNTFSKRVADWSAITSMVFNIHDNGSTADDYKRLEHIAKIFRTNVPNVNRLTMLYKSSSFLENMFIQQLISRYSSNLLALETNANILFNDTMMLGNITKLSVKPYASTSSLFARINLNILTDLRLYDIPSQFKWNIFSIEDEDEPRVRFSSLQNLQLFYTTGSRFNDRSPVKPYCNITIEFPVLKKLYVDDTYRKIKYDKAQFIFPGNMDLVNLRGDLDMVNWVADKNICNCKHLSMMYKDKENLHVGEYNPSEYLETVGMLFRSKNMFRSARATVNIPRFSLKQGSHQWMNLEILEIHNDIAYENLVTFLKKLPNLLVMYANYVSFQYRPYYEASKRDKRLPQSLKPLDGKLHTLKVRSATRNTNIHYNIWCLDRLLLRLPKLERFYANRLILENLKGYNEIFKTEYPHAEQLQLIDIQYCRSF